MCFEFGLYPSNSSVCVVLKSPCCTDNANSVKSGEGNLLISGWDLVRDFTF